MLTKDVLAQMMRAHRSPPVAPAASIGPTAGVLPTAESSEAAGAVHAEMRGRSFAVDDGWQRTLEYSRERRRAHQKWLGISAVRASPSSDRVTPEALSTAIPANQRFGCALAPGSSSSESGPECWHRRAAGTSEIACQSSCADFTFDHVRSLQQRVAADFPVDVPHVVCRETERANVEPAHLIDGASKGATCASSVLPSAAHTCATLASSPPDGDALDAQQRRGLDGVAAPAALGCRETGSRNASFLGQEVVSIASDHAAVDKIKFGVGRPHNAHGACTNNLSKAAFFHPTSPESSTMLQHAIDARRPQHRVPVAGLVEELTSPSGRPPASGSAERAPLGAYTGDPPFAGTRYDLAGRVALDGVGDPSLEVATRDRYLAAPPRMPGSASRRPPQPTDIQSTCLPVRSSIARGCAAAPMPGLEATSQGSTRSPKDLSPRYNIEGLDLSNFDQRSLRDSITGDIRATVRERMLHRDGIHRYPSA